MYANKKTIPNNNEPMISCRSCTPIIIREIETRKIMAESIIGIIGI